MLNTLEEYKKLKNHYAKIKDIHLRDFFFQNPERFQEFSFIWEDILFDFSKNRLSQETITLLIHLANRIDLKNKIAKMFAGEKINFTEGRPVLHIALRRLNNQAILVDGKNIMEDVQSVRQQMKNFSEDVRKGRWKGATGKKITDVINIGIGGSDLGPKMVYKALKHYHDGPKVHYVSNIDGTDINETLKNLDPETTLFCIASKTFTTLETMTNAQTAKKWIVNALGNQEAVKYHFIALSTNLKAVNDFGIDPKNAFAFWDFVGGRYSTWSAIGLSVCIAIGYDRFAEFLAGGMAADEHFLNSPLEKNIPVLLGLIGFWYNNFFNCQTQAILPYDQYLVEFVNHLQQLDMESNGKYVNYNNQVVDYSTGSIIWGSCGTNGQHAYYQLIHQGKKLIPCDFIGFSKSLNPIEDHHDKLMSNYFAQTEALGFGLTSDLVKQNMQSEKVSNEQIKQLLPHRTFLGNVPTNSLLIEKLTPKSLGKLLAIYEHKVFVQGSLWGINSFDQWGVELGKKLASNILTELQNQKITREHDSSTRGLLEHYLNKK